MSTDPYPLDHAIDALDNLCARVEEDAARRGDELPYEAGYARRFVTANADALTAIREGADS